MPSPFLRCRNDWQQKVRLLVAAGVDGIGPGVIVGVIVHVGGAADAVARLHIEADAVTFPEHHGGRPDLDLHLDDFARRQIEPPDMAMIRAIRQRELRIELTMRHPQPAFRHREGRALLAGLQPLLAVGIDIAQREKEIHVLGRTRDPQQQQRPAR